MKIDLCALSDLSSFNPEWRIDYVRFIPYGYPSMDYRDFCRWSTQFARTHGLDIDADWAIFMDDVRTIFFAFDED